MAGSLDLGGETFDLTGTSLRLEELEITDEEVNQLTVALKENETILELAIICRFQHSLSATPLSPKAPKLISDLLVATRALKFLDLRSI